jgi:hypothetical protein
MLLGHNVEETRAFCKNKTKQKSIRNQTNVIEKMVYETVTELQEHPNQQSV